MATFSLQQLRSQLVSLKNENTILIGRNEALYSMVQELTEAADTSDGVPQEMINRAYALLEAEYQTYVREDRPQRARGDDRPDQLARPGPRFAAEVTGAGAVT